MSHFLKVYDWERETWPQFRFVILNREQQKMYIRKLSKHYKVFEPIIKQSLSSTNAGTYHKETIMSLPTIKLHKECTFGTLIHEFSHHLNHAKYNQGHHGRSFKKCLKRVYKYAEHWLPKDTNDGDNSLELIKSIEKEGLHLHEYDKQIS